MKRKLPFLGMLLGVLCAFQLQAQPWPNPEILYYKFENSGTTVPNDALSPPSGTTTANILGAITQGGSGGKCGNGSLVGSGVASSTDYLNTGWATNLPSGSSWTISFWTKDITPSSTLFYIFGDATAGSFRCFTNGVAGANNWIIRGTGMTDVTVAGGATIAPHMTTFVYDAVAGNMKGYLDGVLVTTVTQSTTMSFSGTGPFKVMGYSSNVGAPSGGKLDEFRLYNRALGDVEILGLYNVPSATASSTPSPATVCAGSNLTLTGGGNGAGPYLWSDGTNFITDNTPFVPAVTGTYTVTTTDGAGCTATSTLNVTVNALPSVIASASPTTVCAGAPVNLTATGATSYNWNPGGSGSSVTDYPVANTIYTVTASDGGPCTTTSTVSVSVLPPNASAPTVTEDSVCAPGGVVSLSAVGSNSVTWYDAPIGGSQLSTSTNYSPTISASTTFYVENSGTSLSPPTYVTMPAQTSTFSTNARGYWFTAPSNFVITGLYVPTTASSGAQNIAVLKFTGNVAPPVFSSTTNAFTVEFLTQNNATTGVIPVNIPVSAGEVIGIFGNRANVNSYSNVGNTITINGNSVALTRLGMQFPLGSTSPQDVWQEPVSGNISRVEFEYSLAIPGCPSFPRTPVTGTVNPLPLVTAGITPGTICANASALPQGGGAQTYVWDNGLVDGQVFIPPVGTTQYMVTGTDANGCSATSTVNVTATTLSGQLAASTTSQTQLHGDDLNLQYADISCNLIAGVDDNLGNALGITTATVTVDATAQFHNGQPYVRRWYQITPASNGSADVVLYVNQSDFDDYNAVVLPPYLPMPTSGNNSDPNIPNIRITKNDDAGLGVNPVIITPAVNWNGQYWELAFNTPSFSQFRIHSVNMFNAPLPVVVTEFKGQMLETSDLISWTTSSEMNSAYFVVEYSQNAKDFQPIATVASQTIHGSSQTPLHYQIEYRTPQSGHNYYRLKQVDLDQKAAYHAKVIDLIRTNNHGVVRIHPNPANDVLHVDWNTQKASNVEIKVIDMSGRTVQVTALQTERGAQSATITLQGLSAGIYSVQLLENGTTRFTGRFTKN